jgi:hypothetical protein
MGISPKLLTLLFVGAALASSPAFSQGAMVPGGAPMTPKPAVVAPPPTPHAPVIAPQVPVAIPQAPGVTPNPGPQKANTSQSGATLAMEFRGAGGVGVASKMGDTVNRMTTNAQGVSWFMRNTGKFDVTVSGSDLARSVKTSVETTNPTPQKTLIELLVVIAIIALPVKGEPQVVGRTWPAGTLPANLSVKFDVGSDGIPKGTWSDGVAFNNDPPPFINDLQAKAFLDLARTAKPGSLGVVTGAIPKGK